MSDEKKALSFEQLHKLYINLQIQLNRLEGKNGYIQKAFATWNKDTFESLMKDREDKNILLNQERDERELINSKSANSLRFFKQYYDEYGVSISKGEIPSFLKTRDLELDVKMPNSSVDEKGLELAKKQYDGLTTEQKRNQAVKIARELAITFARHANILNRFKTNRNPKIEETMKAKDIAMENFMSYAINYNKIVPEKDRIVFGINESKTGPILSASLPGYTRLCLHFGGTKKCKAMLKNINTRVKNKYFPTYENSEEINLNKVYSTRGYTLPEFGIVNTGIINHMEHENSEVYVKQMKETISKSNLDEFVNNMHPELNNREMFYIAEMAGLGKAHLERLRDVLVERRKNQSKTYRYMQNSTKIQGVVARKRAEDMDIKIMRGNQLER